MQRFDIDKQSKEFSLAELILLFHEGWRRTSVLGLVGLMGAICVIYVLPKKYESALLVQVGQVGQVGQGGQGGQGGIPVEAPQHAIERMQTHSFQVDAAEASGYLPWIDAAKNTADSINDYCSFQMAKNTNLIEIKCKADTLDDAKKITNALVATLAKRHSYLASASIQKLNYELKSAEDKLVFAEKDVKNLLGVLSSSQLKDDRFSQFALLTSVKESKEQELFSLRQTVAMIKLALAEPATQPAKAIETIGASNKPVSPKSWLILGYGLFVGLIFGILATVIKHQTQARS